ncbi:MAG: GGDEF domain-containing protein [Rhodocyclaceae bacterium]|nr:GGDEF domain-containing protein [Rhodocyclaceae bacterium]
MPAPTNPSEITREALRRLAMQRMPPTPDNFRKLYNEVAEIEDEGAATPLALLRTLAGHLPRDTAERTRLAKPIDQALAAGKGAAAEEAMLAYLGSLKEEEAPAWNTLIGTLIRKWEARQIGWTTARKRDSLDRVLAANDPGTLYARLQGLVRAWDQAPSDPEAPPPAEGASAPVAEPGRDAMRAPAQVEVKLVASGESGEIMTSLRELLVVALETVVPASLGEYPELVAEATRLSASVKASANAQQLDTVARQLRKFAYRLENTAGETAEIRAGLLNLLRLLLENIEEIVIDDQWLHGQVEVLRDVVNKPADVRMIDDAERRIKEVIFKQSQIKHNLEQAQKTLREMLAGFVDQLASFSETTGSYHDKIAANAIKIGQARDIAEIGGVLDEVMRDTRVIQEEARRSRDELQSARDQARAAEARIAELQRELEEASRLMRHDQLTGALNRRGLEETFEKEAARATRRGVSLCVALLDIDNFKKLNDTWGHQTGDEALVHLIGVIRQNLRPNDTVARLGGEEFVILYPESDLEQSAAALVRLQRELTKAYFLADGQKLLITFSAGVSPWNPGEPIDTVLDRADKAMYEAKQTGRNKVVARPAP